MPKNLCQKQRDHRKPTHVPQVSLVSGMCLSPSNPWGILGHTIVQNCMPYVRRMIKRTAVLTTGSTGNIIGLHISYVLLVIIMGHCIFHLSCLVIMDCEVFNQGGASKPKLVWWAQLEACANLAVRGVPTGTHGYPRAANLRCLPGRLVL